MRNLQLTALIGPIFVGSVYAAPRQLMGERKAAEALVERHYDLCGPTTYTVITPKPGAKPTPVTKQFQPVYSCIPEYVVCESNNKKKCQTVYKTSSYRWLSTEVPCYNGLATITRVDQPVTVAAEPTYKIETCRCEEAGPCYYATTSTYVSQPTAFPYVNAGWNYHVCSYSDYYKWYSGDLSHDYSGQQFIGGKEDKEHNMGYPETNGHQGGSSNSPSFSRKGWWSKGWWTKQNEKNSDDNSAPHNPSTNNYGMDTSGHGNTAHGDGWKSLKVEGKSCINGVCKSYPVGYVSKTIIKVNTYEVPYHLNSFFPGSTTFSIESLGITINIKGPTTIDTTITGSTTVRITVTTTKISTSTDVPPTVETGRPRPPPRPVAGIIVPPGRTTFLLGIEIPPTNSGNSPNSPINSPNNPVNPPNNPGTPPNNPGTPPTTPGEPMLPVKNFLICTNNVCSFRLSCTGAQTFRINDLQQLTDGTGSTHVFANNADVEAGAAPFKLGTGDITTAFSFNGDSLVWDVAGAGGNRPASFCMNADNTLMVVFDGSNPAGCQTVLLSRFDPLVEPACLEGPRSTPTTSGLGAENTSEGPEGSTNTSGRPIPTTTEPASDTVDPTFSISTSSGPNTELTITPGRPVTAIVIPTISVSTSSGPDSETTNTSGRPNTSTVEPTFSVSTSSELTTEPTSQINTGRPQSTDGSTSEPTEEPSSEPTIGPSAVTVTTESSYEPTTGIYEPTGEILSAPTDSSYQQPTDEASSEPTRGVYNGSTGEADIGEAPAITSQAPYKPTQVVPVAIPSGDQICDKYGGICPDSNDTDLCSASYIRTAEDLVKCKQSGGQVPSNLVGCLNYDGTASLECIDSCNKDFENVLAAQHCFNKCPSIRYVEPPVKCGDAALSGGNDVLYKACVASAGQAPCTRKFMLAQASEDAATFLTECAAADLLSGDVKSCVDGARTNAVSGSDGAAAGFDKCATGLLSGDLDF